jgi:hypothetical protein
MADHAFARQVSRSKGKDFRLGQFHDDLIANGSLPLSVVEWILLNGRRQSQGDVACAQRQRSYLVISARTRFGSSPKSMSASAAMTRTG